MDHAPIRTYKYAQFHGGAERWKPSEDGVTHININRQKGATKVGRLLARETAFGFTHPYLGEFKSVEAFWWWVKLNNPPEAVKRHQVSNVRKFAHALAHAAEERGEPGYIRRRYFRQLIMDANFYKIQQNPEVYEVLLSSTLPFAQYYYYMGKEATVPMNDQNAVWSCTDMTELRGIFQNGEEADYVPISEAEYHLIDTSREEITRG